MFLVYLGICLLATSFIFTPNNASPIPQDEGKSDILFYENVNDGRGNYKFSFETADYMRREETGEVVNAGQPDQYIEVNGVYSFIRPDDVEETVYYTADKDGYRVVPKPEPIQGVLSGIPSAAVLATLTG